MEMPVWVPKFRGQFAYGDFDFSSSGNKEEREFERLEGRGGLEFYFVGRVMAQYDKLWGQIDAFSGKVGSTFTYIPLVGNNQKDLVYISATGTIPRLAAGYSVYTKSSENSFKIELIPYLGLRHVNILLQSDIFDSVNVVDLHPIWYEPVAGIYTPLNYKRFRMELQVDLGWTKTSSSWVINNRFRYRISHVIDVQLGWTFMRLNYKENIRNEALDFKIRLIGPTAGVGFRF